jgi:hypothetical protein
MTRSRRTLDKLLDQNAPTAADLEKAHDLALEFGLAAKLEPRLKALECRLQDAKPLRTAR